MLGALGTTFFFALTPVFANRAARLLGSLRANLWRLVAAVVLLGAWSHSFGAGIRGAAFGWFFLGGVVGFGLGGATMFLSLPRLGATLSTLIVQCVSALAAALIELGWLGTTLTPLQIFFGALTLAGVAAGLLPRSLPRVAPEEFRAGLRWAMISAVAQGAGAVLSRKAFAIAAAAHEKIDPGTAAYQRALGGLLVAIVLVALFARRRTRTESAGANPLPWVVANALTGPVLGVTCYQWALRTTPAGLVQPIVAIAPLLTIPFAMWIEGAAKPRATYYLGAALAIAGATGIVLAH
ncbi:MAG TPA: EamA family transporter [Opitutaceae bacterium]|nr:EamA family transporter [Opitutaceae bacterium]